MQATSKKLPLLLIIATVLGIAWPILARYFREPLSDLILHFDFAVANFITAAVAALLVLCWCYWLCFRSGYPGGVSKGLPLLVLGLIISGLVLYRPIFRGGVSIDRWEPRWWSTAIPVRPSNNKEVAIAPDPDSFPQFLGPHRDGIANDVGLDFSRFQESNSLWKRPIGQGWSGFIASNNVCFTMQQVGEEESVVCMNVMTGEVHWDYRQVRRHDETLGGVGPRSTPTLDTDRLYCQGANGLLVCLNASNGRELWKVDLSKLLSIPLVEAKSANGIRYQTEQFNFSWGRSGSPLIVGELVVVPGGGVSPNQVSLVAFDKLTGNVRWKAGTDSIGYSSPTLLEFQGVEQIVTVNEKSVTGFVPDTGELLWQFDQAGTSNGDANTSQPLKVSPDRLLTSKGYGMGGVLTELQCVDGKWLTKPIWTNSQVLKTKMTSPVLFQGHAYALSDGILECVNIETGKRKWKSGRFGHGQILLVGDHLLVHGEEGGLTLVNASPDRYQKLGTLETIDGVCWNTLCLYRDFVLVRSDVEARCYQLPRAEQKMP